MKSVFFFFLFLVFGSASFAFVPINKDCIDPRPKNANSPGVNKTILLQLVNEARRKGCKCGDTYYYPAPALTWNDQLEQAALAHSADMFSKKYFSHVSPDGSRAGDRIEKTGYHWLTYGENIGMGFKNEKEVIDGWLKSSGHCKNLMNKDYKEMGIARTGNYWVQNFGSK